MAAPAIRPLREPIPMPDFVLLSIPRRSKKQCHMRICKSFNESHLRCSLVFVLPRYLGWSCGRSGRTRMRPRMRLRNCRGAMDQAMPSNIARSARTTGFAYGSPIPNQLDRTWSQSFGPQQCRGPRKSARRGMPLSKRARRIERRPRLPFVPPENWYEPEEDRGGFRILVQSPGEASGTSSLPPRSASAWPNSRSGSSSRWKRCSSAA